HVPASPSTKCPSWRKIELETETSHNIAEKAYKDNMKPARQETLKRPVLRGAQLIAVASADGGATAVEGSPLPPDIQVQYVQLAPVADHAAAVQ
ncbi:protein BANP, partial [Lates japonicus]